MNDHLIPFLKNLLVLTAILAAISAVIYLLFPSLVSPSVVWLIPFFALSTFLLYRVLLKASLEKFNKFTNYFMAATVIKLLLLLTVIAVYLFIRREDAIRFVAAMFVLYLAYTGFEVRWLLRFNKESTANKGQQKQ